MQLSHFGLTCFGSTTATAMQPRICFWVSGDARKHVTSSAGTGAIPAAPGAAPAADCRWSQPGLALNTAISAASGGPRLGCRGARGCVVSAAML